MQHDIEIRGVSKRYGEMLAVDDVTIDIRRGEFLTLLGPSGCGKTTTLNMIAGFVTPTKGTISIRDRPVTDLPPFERDTSMVFQSYALFPHMTVFDNVAFGLRMRKVGADDVRRRVDEALDMVHLTGLDRRYPRQLSGGQQQRVALARAVVTRPAVLLLDEPLSNLDLKLREAMRLELKSLQRDLGITSVYVTHDQGEALAMSDRVAVMNQGRVEQIGTPDDVYESPTSLFAASFVGATNLLDGTVTGTEGSSLTVELPGVGSVRARPDAGLGRGDDVTVSIRPEKATMRLGEPTESIGELAATVRFVLIAGAEITYQLELRSGRAFTLAALNTDGALRPAEGTSVTIIVPQHHCVAFERAPKEGITHA
ncbi:MAG: ABC transporter ATP-binding protein [Acidimicrobiia bacterium]